MSNSAAISRRLVGQALQGALTVHVGKGCGAAGSFLPGRAGGIIPGFVGLRGSPGQWERAGTVRSRERLQVLASERVTFPMVQQYYLAG